MIARRFLYYFLIVAGIAILTTVLFEFYSLSYMADRVLEQQLLHVRSVAQFVGSSLDSECRGMQQLLEDLPEGETDAAEIGARLRHLRRSTIDEAGIVLIDASRRVLASDLSVGGLPPPSILLPALRKAETDDRPVFTDLWTGSNDRPHVSVVVGHGGEENWRAVVLSLPLDGEEFLRLFGYFLASEDSRLQLLDSRGVALFSTSPGERYRSVVHGTYFTDQMRLGEPAVMRCHSCHETEGEVSEREEEITSVAPVPGTPWIVSVRESVDALFSPIREIAYSSLALVAVILGAFIGFFVLLSRRVLKPIRQLVKVAAGVSPAAEAGRDTFDLVYGDEFATLRQSLAGIRQQAAQPAGAERAPDRIGRSRTREPTAAFDLTKAQEDAHLALRNTLDKMLHGLTSIDPVACAVLFICGESNAPEMFLTQGVEFATIDPAEPVEVAVRRIGKERASISVQEMTSLGVTQRGATNAREYVIRKITCLDGDCGQLWIGLSSGNHDTSRILAPALNLVVSQVQFTLERNLLHDQLRHEHERKNRMLRHLFEAEDVERRRIARDLHDETAQVLSALLLHLETFPESGGSELQAKHLAKSKQLCERLLEEIDRLVRRLRPAVLDDIGLTAAVRATGVNLLTSSGIGFEFELEEEDGERKLPLLVEVAVYRVFQEAMTNILRHAEATSCKAKLDIDEDVLRATVEDDGRGMDESWMDDTSPRPRWGLLGMRERIEQLAGGIEFGVSEAGGVKVEFWVPLQGREQVVSES